MTMQKDTYQEDPVAEAGLTLGASVSRPSTFYINHAWAQDVMYVAAL